MSPRIFFGFEDGRLMMILHKLAHITDKSSGSLTQSMHTTSNMHWKLLVSVLIYESNSGMLFGVSLYTVWCVEVSLGFVDFSLFFSQYSSCSSVSLSVSLLPPPSLSFIRSGFAFIFSPLVSFSVSSSHPCPFPTSLNHCLFLLRPHPSQFPSSLLCLILDSQPFLTFILSSVSTLSCA